MAVDRGSVADPVSGDDNTLTVNRSAESNSNTGIGLAPKWIGVIFVRVPMNYV